MASMFLGADHAASNSARGSIPDVYIPMTKITDRENTATPFFTLWYNKDGVEQTSETISTDAQTLQIEDEHSRCMLVYRHVVLVKLCCILKLCQRAPNSI